MIKIEKKKIKHISGLKCKTAVSTDQCTDSGDTTVLHWDIDIKL